MLGDTLRLIHFPAMSIDEFTKIVVPAGLLEVDEENAVFRALLGAASEPGGVVDGGSAAESAAATKKASPVFPRNSRNFVTTRCDINYDGYMRHGASSSSLFRGGAAMPHRNGWSLTVYCDHSIKVPTDCLVLCYPLAQFHTVASLLPETPTRMEKNDPARIKNIRPTFHKFTHTHSLTAALDQLRVVASSTSNDPGPRSRQHQQIG